MNAHLKEIKNNINIDIIATIKSNNFKKFHFKKDDAEMVRAYFYSENLPQGTLIQVTSANNKESYSYTNKQKGNWYSMTLFGNEISISVYLTKNKIASNSQLKLISIEYSCATYNRPIAKD